MKFKPNKFKLNKNPLRRCFERKYEIPEDSSKGAEFRNICKHANSPSKPPLQFIVDFEQV